jgi:protein SCO1/2
MRSMISAQNKFSTSAFRAKGKTMGQMRQRHNTGPFSWKAALLFVLTGAGMMLYFRVEKARLERKRMAEMSKGVGRPKVGGPFVLKDLDGKEFTEEDLKGKYSFVSQFHRWITGHHSLGICVCLHRIFLLGLLRLHSLPRYLPR